MQNKTSVIELTSLALFVLNVVLPFVLCVDYNLYVCLVGFPVSSFLKHDFIFIKIQEEKKRASKTSITVYVQVKTNTTNFNHIHIYMWTYMNHTLSTHAHTHTNIYIYIYGSFSETVPLGVGNFKLVFDGNLLLQCKYLYFLSLYVDVGDNKNNNGCQNCVLCTLNRTDVAKWIKNGATDLWHCQRHWKECIRNFIKTTVTTHLTSDDHIKCIS